MSYIHTPLHRVIFNIIFCLGANSQVHEDRCCNESEEVSFCPSSKDLNESIGTTLLSR